MEYCEPNHFRFTSTDTLQIECVRWDQHGTCLLEDRYWGAGITSISHDFYPGGRHEMFRELNRSKVYSNLLAWLLSILRQKP
jgi:hypothetical protein